MSLPGNYVSLNTTNCIINSEGNYNISSDLGQVKLKSVGNARYNAVNDSISFNLMLVVDFFFESSIIKKMAKDFELYVGSLNPTPFEGDLFNHGIIIALLGKERGDRALSELNLYGNYRKFPDEHVGELRLRLPDHDLLDARPPQHGQHPQHHLGPLPLRGRRRDRLPDEPVQHRRRGPVPLAVFAAAAFAGAGAGCPGTLNTVLAILVAMAVGAPGPASPACCGHPRGQRGHLDDHAERDRRRRSSATCSARSGVHGGNAIQHQGDPGGQRVGGITLFGDVPTELYGLVAARRRGRRRLLGAAQPDPLRLRPARHRRLRDARRWPAASTSSGWSSISMLMSGAVAGLIGMPTLFGDAHNYGIDVPDRPRLRRHRGRAAGSQQPGRHRLRRAALRLPQRAGQPAEHPGRHLARHRRRSPRASIVLAVVIAYEVVRRYRVRLEQRPVAEQLGRAADDAEEARA